MEKKVGQTPIQLTDNPEDKHPFRKKQQRAVSDESFEEKDVKQKVQLANTQATNLASAIDDFIEHKARANDV